MSGRFIAVVGPSGAGKDSLMQALSRRRPEILCVRRVITRHPDAGGEDFEAVSPAIFAARAAAGDFALHWQAHGLSYAIPASVAQALQTGRDVLANLSRAVLPEADRVFDDLRVLHVTARPEVLANRLKGRGRETPAEVARRLARPAPALPHGLDVIQIDNSEALDRAVDAACAALYPVSA
jgi:ribose 1,5-bisphosphokinase